MDVNQALQRKIKSGHRYDKYFEKVNCKSSFVGKGNTSFGMQQMKELAKKYQYQTAELAKQLRKPTISQTVSNVYEFLYDHLQYQLDGYDQQLRSPACSWQQRQTGIDCKSYSVFASTILLNLGIKHYFRKIKQPTYNPEAWSHVYVIVPDGENYYVIDGTLHQNIEVPFVEKEDLLMEANLNYYALNAPNVAIVRPFQNEEIEEVIDDGEKLKGFTIALNALEKIGVSTDKTLLISQLVKKAYFKNGSFNFPFGLTDENTLLIDGNAVELNLNKGLGVTPISTTIAGIDTSIFTNNTITSNTSSGITGALSTLAVDPTGTTALIGAISSILPIEDIIANVTNVLKYGLSSWGATTSPEGIQGKINELATFASKALGNSDPGAGLTVFNRELKRLKTYYTILRRDHAKAKSTQLAYDAMIMALNEYINKESEIVAKLKAQGYIFMVTNETVQGVIDIFSPNSEPKVDANANITTTYNIYKLIQYPSVNQQQTQQPTYDVNGNLMVPENTPNPPPTAGDNIGKILGYGGALALAGFLVIPMLNKK